MKQTYVIGVLILAIIAFGAWWWSAQPSLPEAGSSAQKDFTLVVASRKLVSGPSVLEVKEGDAVAITITADEEEELHVHGYDLSVDLAPHVPSTLRFVASASGRFPYELEKSKTELGAVEVAPQ